MTGQSPDAGPPFNPCILFDEELTAYKFVGGGIILSAIYIVASAESRKS
jgi:hypothetical protein